MLVSVLVGVRGQILRVNTQADSVYTVIGAPGVDHVYVFSNLNLAEFTTINGEPADWYCLPSTTPVSQGYTTFINVSDAQTYRVEQNGVSETFAVLDYRIYRLTAEVQLSAVLSCESSVLSLSGWPRMQYADTLGMMHTVDRSMTLSYRNLDWTDNGWTEMPYEDTLTLNQNYIVLGKQLCDTYYSLSGDQITSYFYHTEDSVNTITYEAVAFDHHATTTTTIRGTALENEVERPIQETTIKGSAPLNILFAANASGSIDYYLWTLYHYQDVIGTRSESVHRYIFEEMGAYSVDLHMRNTHGCECDTTIADIAVSESLLRVPNVFTPNGDGKNDEFRVAYRSIKEFHCWVYNRWGHLVYEWDDPAKGWDGTIGGRPAPEGAYYYIIRALGTDAGTDQYMSRSSYKRKKKDDPDSLIGVYQLSGDINLLRGTY